ncbi:hypothetical protein BEP19_15835 [Ammoniphilus oxalaticus]|uniref:Uncharacterized protein n=2 Tax=Ammoniphilus oxalaticus TaxID=66863 RepID=A0A419SQS1_9BACL|nr:hypothetical protein BEP19_15835 [Ammoniphilus oxalaticus]
MLSEIPNKYDKTVGFFIFDATRPVSHQLEKAYERIQAATRLLNAANLRGKDLDRFVNQRTGQTRLPATYAIGNVEVVGDVVLEEGVIIQTPTGIQFEVMEKKVIQERGTVPIRSILPGTIGNVPSEQIIDTPLSIPGLQSVINHEPTAGGYEEESDEEFWLRYDERIKNPATSGNKAHYEMWAKEVPGVGGAEAYERWDGPGTVKVVIVNANMRAAESELVNSTYEHIESKRPICVEVTVVSVAEKTIDVNANVNIAKGFSLQGVRDRFVGSLNEYFKEIAFKEVYVSYAKIGSILLATQGVLDYTDLHVNGSMANVPLTDEEVPVLGSVLLEV